MGQTARHLLNRIKEHLKTDKMLHIYQHLSPNQNCFNCCTDDYFSIFDYASTKYQLMIKETLYMKWLDPVSNKKKKTLKITRLGRYIPLCHHSFSYFLPSTIAPIVRRNNSLITIAILLIYI